MSTYLKNMAGYKNNQLKNKSFDDIQKLFDKAIKRVNTFVDMDTELVEGSEVRAEGSETRVEGSLIVPDSHPFPGRKSPTRLEWQIDTIEDLSLKEGMSLGS
ncbi:hypothetical protein Tco_0468839 [Tanacetum coccineum]